MEDKELLKMASDFGMSPYQQLMLTKQAWWIFGDQKEKNLKKVIKHVNNKLTNHSEYNDVLHQAAYLKNKKELTPEEYEKISKITDVNGTGKPYRTPNEHKYLQTLEQKALDIKRAEINKALKYLNIKDIDHDKLKTLTHEQDLTHKVNELNGNYDHQPFFQRIKNRTKNFIKNRFGGEPEYKQDWEEDFKTEPVENTQQKPEPDTKIEPKSGDTAENFLKSKAFKYAAGAGLAAGGIGLGAYLLHNKNNNTRNNNTKE